MGRSNYKFLLVYMHMTCDFSILIVKERKNNNFLLVGDANTAEADWFATLSKSVSLTSFQKTFCRGRLQRHKRLLENILDPFALEKGVIPGWISLLYDFFVGIERISYLEFFFNVNVSFKTILESTRTFKIFILANSVLEWHSFHCFEPPIPPPPPPPLFFQRSWICPYSSILSGHSTI